MSDVKVTVKSVKGLCSAGYKVGDYFMLKDGLMIEAGKPAGLCIYALPALIPYLTAYCRETSPDDWINRKRKSNARIMTTRSSLDWSVWIISGGRIEDKFITGIVY